MPFIASAWNKGKIVGQKAPFRVKNIWALRLRLQMERRVRELALFNLGIDSKLRGCDLVDLTDHRWVYFYRDKPRYAALTVRRAPNSAALLATATTRSCKKSFMQNAVTTRPAARNLTVSQAFARSGDSEGRLSKQGALRNRRSSLDQRRNDDRCWATGSAGCEDAANEGTEFAWCNFSIAATIPSGSGTGYRNARCGENDPNFCSAHSETTPQPNV